MMKIPKYVLLGENVIIEPNVRLGIGKEELGKLVIGDNCKIRSGTVIYRGTKIGNDCQTGHNTLIRERNVLGERVVIGSFSELAPGNRINDYTTVQSHCFLEAVKLGNYVFLAPGVRFLDDRFPVDPDTKNYRGATVGDDVAIGGGSVILPDLQIGSKVLIGAGSVVTKSIPSGEVWAGNPAKFMRKIKDIESDSFGKYLPGNRRRYSL